MVTSTPAMFMPLVSGFYLDVMGVGPAVRYGLMMFTVAAAIAVMVRAKFLQETYIPPKDEGNQSFKETISDMVSTFKAQPRTIWAMTAVGVIGSFAMRMTWSFLSIYATDPNYVGLTYGQYGFLQSLSIFISVPLYYISGIIADKYGRVPCIALARGLGPFDSFSLYGLRNYSHLIAAYGVIGVAQGLGGGRIRTGGNMGGPAWSALIADIVPPVERGKVLGLMGTLAGLVSLPGGIVGGMIYDSNPSLLLLSGSILEAMSIPIILLFIRDVQDKKE
jgi:MFS family permease